jgi:DNA-binding transcriptional MocR family regulator
LWVQLPGNTDSRVLFDQALDQGIGISPGVLFSSRGDYINCLRLSCGLAWDERMDRAMRALGKMVAGMPSMTSRTVSSS